LQAVNKEGNSPTIEYQHWTGQKWIASLQDAAIQFSVLGIQSIIDPDFHHVRQDGSGPHDDQWIQYFNHRRVDVGVEMPF
jgi:hypothetical protein